MNKVGVTVSITDSKIDPNWKEIMFALGEAAVGTAAATATGGATLSSIFSGALNAIKAVRVSEPVESKALALIALAIARALDRVVAHNGITDANAKGAARSAMRAIRNALERSNFTVTRDVLRLPTTLPLYQEIRPDLARIVVSLRADSASDEKVFMTKIDVAFNAAVYEVIRSRRAYFLPLIEALDSPGFVAAELENDWLEYRNYLVERFEVDPVFGQQKYSVSLSQLYVPLGGRWRADSERPTFSFTENVDQLLHDWAMNGKANDDVRLIFGGPGSGKSTVAKALAATLAKTTVVRPILIELQHTNSLNDLRGSIEQRLVHERELFTSDPLAQKDINRPFVIIFDGLDELVVPGSVAANRVADNFVVSLKALLRNLNGAEGSRARVVVTGRSAIMQSFAKAYDVPSFAAIEVMGFLFEDATSVDDVHTVDKRPNWWANYSSAYGVSTTLPKAFEDSRLDEITREPLLCFLMALSGYMTENWSEAAENPNRIYSRLIGEVWHRKWGQGEHSSSGRVGPSLKLKSEDDFNLLMETLAIAAWWGGENRVATPAMFDLALQVTKAQDIWKSFREDDGDEIQNLALMFYMRRSDIDGQGVEFTHKTFSEYLVSRYIMRFSLNKITKLLDSRDIDLSDAANMWCSIATRGRSYRSLNRFLNNEARFLSSEHLLSVHKVFVDFLSHIHNSGLPVHKFSSVDFRALSIQEAAGKANALSIISAVTYALRDRGVIIRNALDWKDDNTSPARFIGSLTDYRGAQNALDLDFPNFDFSQNSGIFGSCLFAVDSDFSGCDFSEGILFQCFMSEADLSDANFKDCAMERGNFRGADFSRADLTDARAVDAVFAECDFTDAILTGALFSECDLDNALMDNLWWDAVDIDTFFSPPTGYPVINVDGVILTPSSEKYPDLQGIYEQKQNLAAKQREERQKEMELVDYAEVSS